MLYTKALTSFPLGDKSPRCLTLQLILHPAEGCVIIIAHFFRRVNYLSKTRTKVLDTKIAEVNMTPKERAKAALELRLPDDLVPTFELEFQLAPELFGTDFKPLKGLEGKELEAAVQHNAELHLRIAERLDYSIIRAPDVRVLRALVKLGANRKHLLCGEADGTMGIPSGENMMEVAYRLFEHPDEVHETLARNAEAAIQRGIEQLEAGAECLTMCADYCFNDGPFLSPPMFAEFVTPYLHRIIAAHRRHGAYVIKHTDGNIMPILDQLVACEPHGLHSLDPQAGVDLAEVKRLVGDKVCLCGNVQCSLLQTGTREEIRANALYALRHGMPEGGYIYCTSNVAFRGLPLERYLYLLELRQQYGRYDRPTDWSTLEKEVAAGRPMYPLRRGLSGR